MTKHRRGKNAKPKSEKKSSALPVISSKPPGAPPEAPPATSLAPRTIPPLDTPLTSTLYSWLSASSLRGRTQGRAISCHPARVPGCELPSSEVDAQKIFRNYLNGLAYFCDYEGGGTTVAAVAIEQELDGGITYQVAANQDTREKVIPSLHEIISFLQQFRDKNQELDGIARTEIPEKDTISLADMCVRFGLCRLTKYYKKLQVYIRNLDEAAARNQIIQPDLRVTLTKFIPKGKIEDEDITKVCRLSYDLRDTLIHDIRDRLRNAQVADKHKRVLRLVAHFILQLSHHFHVAKHLLTASITMKHLFTGWKISWVETHPPWSHLPARKVEMIEEAIDTNGQEMGPEVIILFDNFKEKIRGAREFAKNEGRALSPVHAEVQILDYFHREKLVLAPYNDLDKSTLRYIGCSKPSCRFCWLYFTFHPGEFQTNGTHQNIYNNVALPTVSVGDENRQMLSEYQEATVKAMALNLKIHLNESIVSNKKYPERRDSFELSRLRLFGSETDFEDASSDESASIDSRADSAVAGTNGRPEENEDGDGLSHTKRIHSSSEEWSTKRKRRCRRRA